MRRLLIGVALALGLSGGAFAQVAATLPVKSGNGSSVSIAGQADVGGNFHYRDVMEGLTGAGAPTAVTIDGSGNMLTAVASSALPTGAATSALQTSGNTSLSTLITGQTTGNGSLSSLVSGQTTGNSYLSNVSGSISGGIMQVSLGAGAATAANQSTGNGYLGTLAGAVTSNVVQTALVNPAVVYAGQLKIAVTGTRVCLPTQALVNGVVIKALATNTAAGVIGGTTVTNTQDGTGNGYIVQPGEAGSLANPQASNICVNGTAGDIYPYLGN